MRNWRSKYIELMRRTRYISVAGAIVCALLVLTELLYIVNYILRSGSEKPLAEDEWRFLATELAIFAIAAALFMFRSAVLLLSKTVSYRVISATWLLAAVLSIFYVLEKCYQTYYCSIFTCNESDFAGFTVYILASRPAYFELAICGFLFFSFVRFVITAGYAGVINRYK